MDWEKLKAKLQEWKVTNPRVDVYRILSALGQAEIAASVGRDDEAVESMMLALGHAYDAGRKV